MTLMGVHLRHVALRHKKKEEVGIQGWDHCYEIIPSNQPRINKSELKYAHKDL